MSMLETERPTAVNDRTWTLTINGEQVAAESTFPVYNPATGEVIAEAPEATVAQLDAAIDAAAAAFPSWAATPIDERGRLVSALGDLVEQHAEEFMALLTMEQGKPRAGAEWEVFGSAIWFREIGKQRLETEVLVDDGDRIAVTRYTPLGVVGGITPWNFPILLAVWKIAPALVAGNTIVIKPSPFTPLTSLLLGQLAQDLLPPGVFSVVSGGDDVGQALSKHPKIAKVAFTGSTETGRLVAAAAAGSIKRVTLELGGNDPAIVLPDVDAKAIAPQLFWAAFQNNAQFCNATKRLYIHEDIYDAVRDELVAFAKTMKTGNGADPDTALGPIQNEPQFEKVKEFFADSKAQGHVFALGGEIDESQPGWFVPVTLVDNPPEDSKLVVEEPFGPILPLLKWSDEDDVVARANNTMWGLGATVWGKDTEAIQRIAEQIEAGTVWINEVHQYSPYQAFGGHKQSGTGCENSLHGLMEYTNWQTITRNKNADF